MTSAAGAAGFMPSLNEVMQNARDFLDVAEGMDEAGINRAFKRQALFHHSDRKNGSTKAFQRLNAAKELLIGELLFGSIDRKNFDDIQRRRVV